MMVTSLRNLELYQVTALKMFTGIDPFQTQVLLRCSLELFFQLRVDP